MRLLDAKTEKTKKSDMPDYMKRRCFVRWGGDVVKVLMDPDEPTIVLKQILEEHTGIPVDDQMIFYNGMKKAFEHEKSLRYYGAHGGGFFDLAHSDDVDADMNIIRKARRRKSFSDSDHGKPAAKNTRDMDLSVQEEKLNKQRARRSSMIEKQEELKKLREQEEARLAEEARKKAEEAAKKAAEAERKKRLRNIHVTTPDGQVLTVTLDKDGTVGDIKTNIADDCKIPPGKQVLKYNGKVLDNDSGTLDQLGIPDGAQLTVEPFKIPITVNTPDGKQIQAMVDPALPVAELKKQLEADSGVAANDQKLFLQGKELSDPAKKLEDYGVKAGSVLDMVDEAKRRAEAEAKKKAEQEAKQKAEDARKKAEEEQRKRKRTLTVVTPEGQVMVITHDQDDTIADVKGSIEDGCKIPPSKQVLKYNGQVLDNDGKTLEQLGIPDGARLTVEPLKIKITVNTPDGKQIEAEVDPAMPVADLKKQLEADSGVAANDQKLFLQGKELDDPAKKLEDYGVKEGSVLDMVDEAKRKAEEEAAAKKKAEEEARLKAEAEAKKKAEEEEAKRKAEEEARLKAEAKAEKKAKKKKKKKDDDGSDNSWEPEPHKPKDYSIDFTPTPLDLTRFKAWFMIGDQVPFEMICPIAMDIKGFKVEILKLRNEARFVKQYFEGLEDPNELKIYPAGSWGEGEPLPEDIPVPKDSSEYKFFSVLR